MQIKEKDVLSNFKVVRIRDIKEFDGTLFEFEHYPTGAKLAWLKTMDENKVFSISFKTLPSDSTGVFHIMEHSVLNGSQGFPMNSLFVELLKGSLQTFLNAATYSDHTEFPVSSRNSKDFLNLIKVYLDSVLFPLVLQEPRIFQQEGWHYELDESSGELLINGVVYNEMMGAFSSAETRLYNNLDSLLFAGTSYSFVSGGDPKDIPNLTYEKLKSAHKEFYHPTNSYTYLDGDMDIESVLKLIDSYFSRFTLGEEKNLIIPKSLPHVESYEDYAAFSKEEGSYLCVGQLIQGKRNKSELMAYSILSDYLTGNNDSPLKKAILDNGIAYDVDFFINPNCIVPHLGITLRQMDSSKKDEALAIISSIIDHIIKEGIPREAILAEINHLEYIVKDIEEPKGINRMTIVNSSWLYDGDPLIGLSFDKVLSDLRSYLDDGTYIELLKRINFNDDGTALCMLTPSITKEKEDYAKERQRLNLLCNSFTKEQKEEIQKNHDELITWQNSPASDKVIDSLPRLSICDLDETQNIKTEVSTYGNTTILFHPANTNGINHYCLYFSIGDFSPEEIQLLSLLTNLYTQLPTRQYELTDLMTNLKSNIGIYDFNISAYSIKEDLALCKPYFRVEFSTLETKENEAFSLICEILHSTDFTSRQSKELIYMILRQCQEELFHSIQENGNRYAIIRANSHLTASGMFADATEGIDFYRYLNKLIETYDIDDDSLFSKMEKLANRLFIADRLTASVVAYSLNDKVQHLATILGHGKVPEKTAMKMTIDNANLMEYCVIPSMVSYAAISGILPQSFQSYNGSLEVLANILDYDYLWNEIRVSGGAYGCGCFFSPNGTRGCFSYRDPNPLNSIEVFTHQAEFLDEFLDRDQSLETYIIGAYSTIDPLMHIRQKALVANNDYFLGITSQKRKCYRKELLETSKKDLSKLRDDLLAESGRYAVCIIGNADSYKSEKGYLLLDLCEEDYHGK